MSKLKMTPAIKYFLKLYGMTESQLRKEFKEVTKRKSPHKYDFHIRWALVRHKYGEIGIKEVYNNPKYTPKDMVSHEKRK